MRVWWPSTCTARPTCGSWTVVTRPGRPLVTLGTCRWPWECGPEGDFVAKPRRSGWVAQMADVWRGQTSKDVQVWDNREPAEWSGAEKKAMRGERAESMGRLPELEGNRLEIDGSPPASTAREIQQ